MRVKDRHPAIAQTPHEYQPGENVMAEYKRQTPQTAATIADAIAQMQRFGLQSMNWMGAGWVERMSDLNSEALAFLSERVKQDVELQHRLLHCKTIEEMQHVQAEFLQTAIDQYTEETGKMIDMAGLQAQPDE